MKFISFDCVGFPQHAASVPVFSQQLDSLFFSSGDVSQQGFDPNPFVILLIFVVFVSCTVVQKL